MSHIHVTYDMDSSYVISHSFFHIICDIPCDITVWYNMISHCDVIWDVISFSLAQAPGPLSPVVSGGWLPQVQPPRRRQRPEARTPSQRRPLAAAAAGLCCVCGIRGGACGLAFGRAAALPLVTGPLAATTQAAALLHSLPN